MVKLRKEELNSLVGQTIYHYYLKNPLDYCFAKDTKINVSQLEIFKVYEEDSSCETSRQYIYTKGCKIYQVDVKDIGNPSVIAEDWDAFPGRAGRGYFYVFRYPFSFILKESKVNRRKT